MHASCRQGLIRRFVAAFYAVAAVSLSSWIASPAIAAPVITFNASPTSIASGGTTTLTWSVVAATSCAASSANDPTWTGSKSEVGGGEDYTPTVDTTYTLTCTDGIDPDESVDAIVTVGPPVSASLSSDFIALPLGGSAQLDWNSANANDCVGTNFSTSSATSGSQTVTPGSIGPHQYDVLCTGEGGATATDSITVTVGPAVTASITSDFLAIPLGGSVQLDWASTDANTCVGTNFSTSGTTLGSESITPVSVGVVLYEVDCTGDGGATVNNSVSVTVGPAVTATITSDFLAIPLGGSVQLDWASTDADSCVGTNFGTGGLAASSVDITPVSVGEHPYGINCTGDGGATGTATVLVTVGPAVIASLSADFITLPLGGSVEIAWGSADANICAGTNFATGGAASGTATVTPGSIGSYQYDLLCTGDGGATTEDSVTVTVGAAMIASLLSDFSTIPLGGTVQLDWTSSDANQCTGTNFSTATATAGSETSTPGAQGAVQYDVVCTGNGGATANDSVTVTVGPPVIASITSDFLTVPLGGSPELTWTSSDANTCVGTNFATGNLAAGTLSVIPGSQGIHTYDVLCTGDGGATAGDSVSVMVGAPVTATITSDFLAIPLGGSVELAWSSSDANTCSGTGFVTGGLSTGSETITPLSQGVVQYDLLCTGDGNATGANTVSVMVGPPVGVSLTADFLVVPLGGSVELDWTSSSATQCTGSNFASGGATAGTATVTPVAQGLQQYDLDCSGDGGATGSDTITVSVGAPVSASVSSDFLAIPFGGSVLLSWNSTDANSCSGTNFATGGLTFGSVSVDPGAQGAQDYDLLCTGDGGATGIDTLTVAVGPPVVASVSSNLLTVPLGGSVQLTWSSTEATTCAGTGFATSGAASGSVVVAPGAVGVQQYDLLCTGDGSATGMASVSVTVGPPIVASLASNFATIPLGGSVQLDWTSTDANTCSGTGFATSTLANGNVVVMPVSQGAHPFDLLCTGDGGATGVSTVTVVVGAPVIASVSANFLGVPLGGSVQLDWTSSDATTCAGTNFSTSAETLGSTSVIPGSQGPHQYDLLCTGNGGATGSDTVTVIVGPPVTASMSADFLTVPLGGQVQLNWGSTDANTCVGTNFLTSDTVLGSVVVMPSSQGPHQYDLLCTGDGGAFANDSITVTVGAPISASLVADFTSMPLGGSAELSWSSSSANSCVGTGFSASSLTLGSATVTPSAQGVQVYDVVCTGNGGATGNDTVAVTVGAPIAALISSNFLTVPLGGNIQLDWSSSDANSCVGTNFSTGSLAVGSVSVVPVAEGSQTYTALCSGNGGATGSASVTVTVIPPVTVSLNSNLVTLPLGGSVQLTWTGTSATSCTGTNFATATLTNGSVVVEPVSQGVQQFDIACIGNGGASDNASVFVTVGPPITVSVVAAPGFIALGGTSTMSWASTDASSCNGDIFSTSGLTVGSAPVSPVADATYVVTCSGAGGAMGFGSADVTVGPPVTTTLTANFATIALGGSSTLTWNSANADTCTASTSPGDLAWSGGVSIAGGSQLVSPTVDSTYTLTCVGAGGATDSSSLTVVVGPPVVADLSADFTFIALGGSASLTWTSSNATSCNGDSFSTGGTTNSTRSVSPTANTTYTLTCVGLGNAIETSSVTVVVGPAVTASLTSDLVFIAAGGTANLSWTGAGGAESCTGDGDYSTGNALNGTAPVSPIATTTYTLTCDGSGNASTSANATITVGPAPTASLVGDFSNVPLGGTVALNWSSSHATSCTSADFATSGNVGGTASVTPVSQGAVSYTLTCDAPGGATVGSVFVVNVGAPVSVAMTSTPGLIASGGTSSIGWSSTSANSCSGDIISTGGTTSGSVDVSPTADANYIVTCIGDGGSSGSDSLTLSVGPPVSASITASPAFIAQGGTSTLSWVGAGGATTCADDLQFVTNGVLVGNDAVNPTVTTSYTLTCQGAGNAVETAEVTVEVGPPVVATMSTTLTQVAPGGTAILSWTGTGSATSCNGDFFVTGGELIGSVNVMPTVDTTYTVSCFGPGGVIETESVTVTLGPPVTVTLESDLPFIPLGGSIVLEWASTEATSCVGTGFSTSGLAMGMVSDTPAETIVYEVTCFGAGGGSGTATTSVIVGDAVAATLSVDLDSIALGGQITLMWASGNADDGCTGFGAGFNTGGAESGTAVISPLVSTLFQVVCAGEGGTSANSSTNVTVDPPLTASLVATPAFIASGGASNLAWSSVSASICSGDFFTTAGNTNSNVNVSPTSDTTYTLTCSRAGSPDVTSSATVTVGPPVATTLSSEFSAIALGGSSLLTWTSENADSCAASSVQDLSWTGARSTAGGSLAVSPTGTSVYEIDCTGPGGGTDNATVIVTVGAAVTASISALPSAIALGGSSQLNWSSANAINCTGDLFSTGGAVNGNATVVPASEGTHIYTLTCNGLGNVVVTETVSVTVGAAVTASLSASPAAIASGGSSDLTWSSTNATSCNGDIFATSGSTAGTLAESPTTTTTFTLTCVGAGDATATDTVTISVGPAVTTTITADIESVALGGTSSLTWGSANATSCTASSGDDPAWFGPRAIAGGTLPVTPNATSTYVISCVGAGDAMATDSVTIAVGPAVTAALTSDFATIASGGTTTLTWLGAGGATSCSGDIFSTGGATGGSIPVSPTVDTTYNLTCIGAGGASQVANLTVVVGAPVTASLTVDIDSIAQGGTSTLAWSSANATTCMATSDDEDGAWAGSRAVLGGTQAVTPAATTTYQLTCSGLGNADAVSTLTVVVGPSVTATLVLNPLFINLGGSSLVTWTSTNATSCVGVNFSTGGDANGSVSVTPSITTLYSITCTGPGNATAVASGTVVVGGAVTASLTAGPTFIADGGSSTLSWNGDNATTCTGDIFSTGGSTNSSLVVSPSETTTYTVTCAGAGAAEDSASVTVTVGPSVTASLTSTPGLIAEGGTSSISWTGGGGATSCSGDSFSTAGALSGSVSVNPIVDTTYTLTCTGPGDATNTATATVNVGPPVVAGLSASLITIAPGGSTDLSWTGTGGATSCTGDLFSTGGLASGTISVSPATTTRYTVTCVGAGAAVDSASVTVTVGAAVTASLVAVPDAIAAGGSSDLSWSSTGATTCTGDGFSTSFNPTGTATVFPTVTTIYTVTCTGDGGATAVASATVTVGSAVTAILTADIETIADGGSTTLTWGSGNANTCTASSPQDPAWAGDRVTTGGSMVVSPVVDATYTLSCDGAGAANDTVDVDITVGPAVVAGLGATPEFIALGGTSTLDWLGSDGATSCEGDHFSTVSELSGSVDVQPTETTVYTVTCFGLGGATESASITVTVGPSVVTQLSASIGSIALGGSSTLTWSSTNATMCTASSVEDFLWSGAKLVSGGTMLVTPIATATYVLECDGAGGATTTASVTVLVGPAVTASLTSDLPAIAPGGAANLTWLGGGGAASCSGDGFATSGNLTGSVAVTPTSNTTYIVNCFGAGGATSFSSVTVAVGPAVNASVSADFETIALGGSSLLSWSSSSATTCTATSAEDSNWNGDRVVVGGTQPVSPTISSTYSLLCVGDGGASSTDSVTVTVGPSVASVLTASFTDIALGGTSTLTFSSANATVCTATSDNDLTWIGPKDINGGSMAVSPEVTSTYTLECDGLGGASASVDVVVNVGLPVMLSLTSTPSFINTGGSSTLSWAGTGGATSCSGDLFATGNVLTGSVSVTPALTTTYTLTCFGDGGAIETITSTVTVGPAVGVTISATPEFIASGGATTLSWNSGNANTCTASSAEDTAWFGDKSTAGSTLAVTPTVTSTYTLVCEGEGGANATASVTVTVGPAVSAELSVDLVSIPAGGTATLSWLGTAGATRCNGDSNFSTSGSLVGSAPVTPLVTTTYVLTCVGPGAASSSDSLTVDVTTAVAATISASPDSIALGGASTLTWSSSDALSCAGTNFDASDATAGSLIVNPTSTTPYSIVCTGIGGAQSPQVSQSVLVGPALTVTLTTSPGAIALGGSSTLAWTSANATTCDGNGFGTGGAVIGSLVVSPGVSTLYEITCTGPGGATVIENVTLSVGGQVLATLSASPATIAQGGMTTLAWDGSAAATSCSGIGPGFNTGGLASGSVPVSPAANVVYTVTCVGPGGVSDDESVSVTVLPPIDTDITVDVPVIALGGSSTLTWSSQSASTCTASSAQDPLWAGLKSTDGGTQLVLPTATTVYVLRCDAPGGTSEIDSVTVTVGPPVTVSLAADLTSIALGGTSTLTWVVEEATSCIASSSGDPVWNGSRSVSGGSEGVSPGITSTYTIECTGPGGATDSETVTINVGPAVSATLDSNLSFIGEGGSAVLTWSSLNATSCDASSSDDSAWDGPRAVSGASMVVTPTSTSTYLITCTGAGGATGQGIEIITVGPPVGVTLGASVESIALGGTSTLTWSSANADTCSATSQQDVSWAGSRSTGSGTQEVAPTLTSIYVLDCVGAGGATGTASITVVVGPPVTVTLVATPEFIAPGGITTLTWDSDNASSCYGENFPAFPTPTGTATASPLVTVTYVLTCIGAGGATASDSVTVVVGDAVTAILSAADAVVAAGGTTQLSWDSENATSCDGVGFSTDGLATGTVDVTLGATPVTFVLDCTGAGDAVESDNTTVSIAPIPTATLSGNSPIRVGGTTTVVWSSSATSCVGDLFSTGVGSPRNGVATVTAFVSTIYTVTCTDDYGQSVSRSYEIVVLPGPLVTFEADLTSVQSGDPVELTWSVTGASSCEAFGGWTGNRDAINGNEIVTPFEDTIYTLRCNDSVGQSHTAFISVTIAPEIEFFNADPVSIAEGGSSSLIWSANHADSCTASANWGGGTVGPGPATFLVVNPPADDTYTLTCTGPGGLPDVADVRILVGSAVTVNMGASPDRIGLGQTTRLSWNTALATSCTATSDFDSAFTGIQPVNGNFDVTPTRDTTYTLNCVGAGGAPGGGSVTVSIADPLTVSLVASAGVIAPAPAGMATLTWATTRDDGSFATCAASASPASSEWTGNLPPNNGSIVVSPGVATIYTLDCAVAGLGQSESSSVSISIAPIPTVTLAADKFVIAAGGLVELTWSSTDTDQPGSYCFPTEPWTDNPAPTSGTAFVSPLEATTYEMVCRGLGLEELEGSNEDTAAPTLVIVDANRAVYETDSWGEDVEVRSDEIALIASYEDGLHILDVRDRAIPSSISDFDPETCANETPFGTVEVDFILEAVAIDEFDEDLIYLSAGPCGLWTVDLDIQNGIPNPTVLSIIDTEGWTEHVALVGSIAFVADYNGGVLVVDVSDPASPQVITIVAFNDKDFGAALEVEVLGNYAYVASSLGLRVLDVSVPAVSFVAAIVDTDVGNGFVPQGIAVYNDLAFLPSWTGGLLMFDVLDPTAPLLAGLSGRIATTDYAFYKIVVDEIAERVYVAEGIRGIRVLDIVRARAGQDPFVEQIDIGRFVWDVGLANGELFTGFGDLSDQSGGFQTIIDRD